MSRFFALLLVGAALLFLACSPAGAPAPTATPTALAPTPAATPTALPSPTIAPTATATPRPTGAPTATPAPTVPPTPTPEPGPAVQVGDTRFAVEVAATPEERQQGLTGHAPLEPETGMLFVFDDPARYSFWMPGMLFALDMVWIAEDCRVADITRDAPPQAPGQSLGDLPRYRPAEPVLYVLEITGGEAARLGVEIGDPVAFTGSLAGQFGC